MATSPSPLLDPSLAQSVEEDGSSHNAYTSLADESWDHSFDAPTPAFRVGSESVLHWSRSSTATPSALPFSSLTFLPLPDWDRDAAYDDMPPTCIRYSIDLKVKVNKVISKDTESDIVVDPASYWRLVLQPRLDALLQKKFPPPRSVCPDEADVVISVTGRTDRPFTKRFEELNIDWSAVGKNLLAWSELFRKGKKLRVDICVHYMESDLQKTTDGAGNKRKTGRSATKHMLAERAAQLDAQQASTGQPSAWRRAYAEVRCLGPPACDIGPYCFCDSHARKRRQFKIYHLRALVRYVESGQSLRNHDDIPDDIRQQIYAEE